MARNKILGNSDLEKDKIPGGLADDTLSEDFNSDELAKGIEIEKEHTDDEKLAEEIAKDHLKEIPDYYTRLQIMEEEAKAEFADTGEGEDIPESTEDVLLLLTLAARQNCKAQLNIPTDEEGRVIAQQLGLIYNGLQEQVPPKSSVYTFTEPTTRSTILASNFDEAREGMFNVIERFRPTQQQSSKLNLTKTSIDWPWSKSDPEEKSEELVDETVEPVARITPPQFQTRSKQGSSKI